MMLKKDRFREMLAVFFDILDPIVDLRIALQTNAMLVDDEWLSILSKYNVYTSVSLDGAKEDNDKCRVDHQGRGTYDRAVKGFNKLKNVAMERGRLNPGIISVVHPESNGQLIYKHFVNDLGVTRLHLLLPEYSHLSIDGEILGRLREVISQALDEWIRSDVRKVYVKMFNSALMAIIFHAQRETYAALTIRSDGALNPPDDLRNVVPDLFNSNYNVTTNSLSEFIESETMSTINAQLGTLPEQCNDCGFRYVCRGGNLFGQPEHRYSVAKGFCEKSVYCDIYKMIFIRIIEYLISIGYSWKHIKKSLVNSMEILEAHNDVQLV